MCSYIFASLVLQLTFVVSYHADWNNNPRRCQGMLPPTLLSRMKTLEMQEIYARDPARIPTSPRGDVIANPLLTSTESLTLFSPSMESRKLVHCLRDVKIIADSSKVERHITSAAWNKYERAAVFAYPHREKELATTRETSRIPS